MLTIRPLTLADAAGCVAVENAAFTNPDHRASPEKFQYRLTVCPELCLGAFHDDTLVGHIIATRCAGQAIVDADMDKPEHWRDPAVLAAATVGHRPRGSMVGVHSLAVAPDVHGQGVGSTLMKRYAEHLAQLPAQGHPPVSRIALICQDYLVKYYEKLGYTLDGPSAAQFGGGGWFDMYLDL